MGNSNVTARCAGEDIQQPASLPPLPPLTAGIREGEEKGCIPCDRYGIETCWSRDDTPGSKGPLSDSRDYIAIGVYVRQSFGNTPVC